MLDDIELENDALSNKYRLVSDNYKDVNLVRTDWQEQHMTVEK